MQLRTMRYRPARPSSFRALAAALLVPVALAASAASAAAAEVKLVRVWPEYRAAGSFTRIAEYFGGREKAPEKIVRSQPDARDGYYFLTRFKSGAALPGSVLVLEYVLPGEEQARVQFFPVDLPKGSRAFLAGLTGADWPGAKTEPTAWRLRLLGPDGTELARQQSFLWSLPAASAALPPATPPADTAAPVPSAPAS